PPALAPLVPAPPDARFDPAMDRPALADLVLLQRPPGAHFLGEAPPRDGLRRLHVHDLPHAVRIGIGHHLLHRDSLSLAASRSAAFLNAASASSQNPLSQPRRTSIPLGSTA